MTFTLDGAPSVNFSQERVSDLFLYLVDNFGFQSMKGLLDHYTAIKQGEVEQITGSDGQVLKLTGDINGSITWALLQD